MKNERSKRPEYLKAGLERLVDRMSVTPDVFDPGLESIISAETRISEVEELYLYHGYPIADLARESSFLETAYLLIAGELPSLDFLADFQTWLFGDVAAGPIVDALLHSANSSTRSDSFLGNLIASAGAVLEFDSQVADDAFMGEFARLMALSTLGLSTIYTPQASVDFSESGSDAVGDGLDSDFSFAGNLLLRLTSKRPTDEQERAFDAALSVLADQGIDASTFAARAVISGGGDFCGALAAAAATCSGSVHAGPRFDIVAPLFELSSVDEVSTFLDGRASDFRPIDGFDSRSMSTDDSRLELLREMCDVMASETGRRDFERIARCFEEAVRGQFGLQPTIYWHLSRLFEYLGIPQNAYRAVTIVARLPGWAAHACEQRTHNQLIRPRGRYVGPERRKLPDFSTRG
ncbi:citrate/2-methylcitrate synthase [Stratiformator vulcanicus]|uniref:citrate synthase (unknown stereospecificity) n=1 Tax=Stratiformator vulcanicus TaxID=2527980 RepID=A0A517R028_9PLAN|nr:citrate/2-methylcitrate synthase [Stratiformator vulcanicus]QDT37252.1 Citrate synthase [Stratiformator vulcanicus]